MELSADSENLQITVNKNAASKILRSNNKAQIKRDKNN